MTATPTEMTSIIISAIILLFATFRLLIGVPAMAAPPLHPGQYGGGGGS